MKIKEIPQSALKGLKTYSLKDRKSKVSLKDFAKAWSPGDSFQAFLEALPNLLGARDFKSVVKE